MCEGVSEEGSDDDELLAPGIYAVRVSERERVREKESERDRGTIRVQYLLCSMSSNIGQIVLMDLQMPNLIPGADCYTAG